MNRGLETTLCSIGLCLVAVTPARADLLYGTMYNGTLGGVSSYTFSQIDTSGATAGNAHPLFSFNLPFGIMSMAFDQVSGKFIVLGPTAQFVEIDAAAQSIGPVRQITGNIPGAVPGPNNNFTGIEFDPRYGLVVSYGQEPTNSNAQNRLAVFDLCDGHVTCFTNPLPPRTPGSFYDADSLVFNPTAAPPPGQLIIADTNNTPFDTVTGLCVTNPPTLATYASPPNDGELNDPACDSTGAIYFSRRDTTDLWRLSGNTFVLVGPHLATPSTAWAVGLAFGTAEPCTGFDAGPTCWTARDRNASAPYDCNDLGAHGPAVTWHSSGGNPGGYISTFDNVGDFYWRAPSAFLGDQSARCGQALCFDVISDEADICPYTTNTPNLVVLMPISGPVVAYDAPFPFANVPPNTWHHWSVPFDQYYCGWHHPCDGTALAPGELCSVLANLQSIDLLAEYGNGHDTGGLDNVCACPLPLVCTLHGNALYGAMFRSTTGGNSNYTFAEVSTIDGHVTPLFDFTVPFGIGGMAFDPESGKFVVVGGSINGQITEIDTVTQTVSTHTITGLPAGNTYVQAVEYDQNQPAGKQHMLISFGPNNSNADNRLARVNSTTGVVLPGDFTAGPVAADADSMAYSPATREFIIADTNNVPFITIDSVGVFSGGPPAPVTWANAPNDPEYWEPACDDSGRMYFSNRTTMDLSYILKNTNSYVLVGPHTGISPATWAHGLAFGAVPTCVPPPPNMVAWWPFDELTGTTAADVIGGHNGTHVNGPTPLAAQYVGNSLCFDGIDDYVSIAAAPALDFGTGPFTIDAWVKRDPAGTNSPPSVILDKRAPGTGVGYSLSVSFGRPLLTMSGTNFATTTAPILPDGRWHFVAVTVNRAANGGLFYVDGKALDTFSPVLTNLNNTNGLQIGKGELAGNQPWLGCLDELELYNRALEPCEVEALFCAHQAGKCRCHCLGDVNGDGHINGLDVAPFIRCLLHVSLPTDKCLCADMDGDGSVMYGPDVAMFISSLLTKQPCPP